MARCIIIAPLYRGEEAAWLTPGEDDCLICADGGYDAAIAHGLKPDLVVGDFDSMPEDHVSGVPKLKLPVHKDDTDMVVCLAEGRRRGYTSFVLAGCMGGRFDHTMSNLQCLYDCALRGEEAWMCDGQNRVTILLPGQYVLPGRPGRKLSLLAFSPEVRDVCLKGTMWTLEQATLTNRYPLGCSNEIVEQEAVLSFREGAMLVVDSEELSFVGM